MPYSTASLLASVDKKDLAVAILGRTGMLGCEEADGPHGTRLTAYYDAAADLDHVARELAAAGLTDVTTAVGLPDQDWNAAWRESIQPVRLTPDIWVSPAWRPPAIHAGEQWIRIEPKMAFGTGHHESTRLAAWGIVTAAKAVGAGRSLLDIGTGSGVLCFLAGLAGFSRCVGVEIDKDCRENLAENGRGNQVGAEIGFAVGGVECIREAARFDVVVMNMIFNESAPLLGRAAELLAPGGRLVWSGILVDGRDETVAAADSAGFNLTDETRESEWWAGVWGRA